MAKTVQVQETSTKRHFQWTTKVSNNEDEATSTTISFNSFQETNEKNNIEDDESSSKPPSVEKNGSDGEEPAAAYSRRKRLQLAAVAVSRLRALLTALGKNRRHLQRRPVLGTLFGSRRGHVHFALQKNATLQPALLLQLSTPITELVGEMASGLVRIALESDKKGKSSIPLLEEAEWRAYCNGIKCGSATRYECGAKEWKILKAVEPISMGAGVLPAETEGDEELIYLRAKFERVVGSADSEAFYMVNPDDAAAPELSIYLLRL
ncbi:protein MIZU-KUSSEI 1 [Sesamum alatum]|uniref:Protein MIZU-KUSSEI 1 n=1 Tax=Sesamum alatum TaxID=300844 RepID=A0AAE1YB14_9LAMI|nr:protein MIZU-KUSSEI 1 [Sesamum alatum]